MHAPDVPSAAVRGRAAGILELADLPLREDLRGVEPYGAPQLDVPVMLNVNENPYPPPPEVVADVADSVAAVTRGMNRYPDREAGALRADLAAYLERDSGVPVRTEQVWAANGSNEVMLQLLQAFGGPGRTALSFGPTYSMYPEYARDSCTAWVTGRRADDFSLDLDHARELIAAHEPTAVLIASPNNPTGTAVSLESIEEICRVAPGIVVVDEAYAEFRRPETRSALNLLDGHPRLVVTRTMSKAFALAGGRVGYLAAAPAIVDALRIVRLPYHLSAVTQEVARAALRHADALLARVKELRERRDETASWLRAQGFSVADSDSNFILFGRFADRHTVWQGILDEGVLIRETGPDGWLRVSIGSADEMAAFRTALEKVTEPLSRERVMT